MARRQSIATGLAAMLLLLQVATASAAERLRVGASTFAYSDLAQQIGGAAVRVELMKHSGHDSNDKTANISPLDLIILDESSNDGRFGFAMPHTKQGPAILEAVRPRSIAPGLPSHPWYDRDAMDRLAQEIASALSSRDPGDAPLFASNLARFQQSMKSIDTIAAEIANDYRGSTVILTDTLFLPELKGLHFSIQDEAYANSAQADRQLTDKRLADLKQAILLRKASILIYNRDSPNPATKILVDLANENGIPVVGLREDLPTGLHYQQWMSRQLNAVRGALNEAAP